MFLRLLLAACSLLVVTNAAVRLRNKRLVDKFEWKRCDADMSKSTLKLDQFEMGPLPILLPGNLSFTMVGESSVQIDKADIELEVKRKTFLLDIPIPCLFNIGSCTYKDSCTLLDRMDRENWGSGVGSGISKQIVKMLTAAGVPDSCPLKPMKINIKDYKIELPGIPSLISFFASGDYWIRVRYTNSADGSEIGCVEFTVSADKYEPPCTGWLCNRRK